MRNSQRGELTNRSCELKGLIVTTLLVKLLHTHSYWNEGVIPISHKLKVLEHSSVYYNTS